MNQCANFWRRQMPTMKNMFLKDNALEMDLLERPEIHRYLPSIQGKQILDLGAGIGRFTGDFAKSAQQITAVDFAPLMIEENQQRNREFKNIHYLCSNAMDLSFPKESFDLIFISWLFIYLTEREVEELALKMTHWLTKGGHLFFRESCHPVGRQRKDEYTAYYRPISFYHELMDPLFTLVQTGSIKAFIDECADPFKCYWLYTK